MRIPRVICLSSKPCLIVVAIVTTLLCVLQSASPLPGESPTPPPLPVMPIPTARQLEWQKRELAMFVHFTVNTFTNREWGTGSESPTEFSPSVLDVSQWVDVAREFGFKTIILTAKHHDGFCLWPSRFTRHSVMNSPWKGGQGDVVKDLADACRAAGLKLGLYLSPWDRHEVTYGDELRYNLFYLGQLRELLTQYGPVAEVWFDGAKGEDAREMEYYFDRYWALVRQLQPGAVIFSDEGPDIRWIGNENGVAGETCWSTMNRSRVSVGNADTAYLNSGDPEGRDWVPGETDVSIRRGWFWHEDQAPKSLAELMEIYFNSVGRNSVLLLNLPPDKRGLIPEADTKRLRELRRALDEIFESNLAVSARATASEVREGGRDYRAAQVLDGKLETYWAPGDAASEGFLELEFDNPRRFNVAMIQEPIMMGQRVKEYRLEALIDGNWSLCSKGTTVGYKKLDRFETVQTRRVRLVISKSKPCPLIAELGLYFDPGRP